jgi:hypothetical protein
LGYVDGNIQIMSKVDNCIKGAIEKKLFWESYYSVRGLKVETLQPLVDKKVVIGPAGYPVEW